MDEREKESAGTGASASSRSAFGKDEKDITFGKDKKGGEFLMSPALLTYMSEELKTKPEILKNMRKYRDLAKKS